MKACFAPPPATHGCLPRAATCTRRGVLAGAGALCLGVSCIAAADPAQRFPDVLAAKVRATSAGTFDFDITVSSSYDTPARYADGFRVVAKDGKVLGERKLFHDHQGEQPFTRDLYGVRIAPGIRSVTVQARDQVSGYGGRSIEVALPGR